MSDDDSLTPERGVPVRVYTPVEGVPIYGPRRSTSPGMPALDPPPRRSRSDTDELDDHPELQRLLEAWGRRKLRWLRATVGAALVAAGGALLAAAGKLLDAREASGAEKQRFEYLEREVMFLRQRDQQRWRIDEAPAWPWRAPAPPSVSPTPAPKGTDP